MYQTHKTFIKREMKMVNLIMENPTLIICLEHFNIDFAVNDKTIDQMCNEVQIDVPVFLIIANLYNGFYPVKEDIDALHDIQTIMLFLQNSHRFYKYDKYPAIKKDIQQLHANNASNNILLIERFFDDYFVEVKEHLDYEEQYAFPYFKSLILEQKHTKNKEFVAQDYKEHHTDIETKLADLKNLLLKHVALQNDLSLRRKILLDLFELEFDLKIHSLIEEIILMPLVARLEKQVTHGAV